MGKLLPNTIDGFTYVTRETGSPEGLMLLHGTGGDEYDLVDLGRYIAPDLTLISPRGRAPENGMNRWFARHAEGILDEQDIKKRTAELHRFLPKATQAHGVSAKKLWALGFSNGANMAAAMLLLYPESFAGAVLFRPMLPLKPENLPDLKGKHLFIAAGTHDTMIPRESTEMLIGILQDQGAVLQVNWATAGHGFGQDEVVLAKQWFDSVLAGQ